MKCKMILGNSCEKNHSSPVRFDAQVENQFRRVIKDSFNIYLNQIIKL